MKELCKRINLILANWNPLSIPKNIAEVEYLHYIPIGKATLLCPLWANRICSCWSQYYCPF